MTNKEINETIGQYMSILKDGQADLNDAYSESDEKGYYAAIERHLKLTEAVMNGILAAGTAKNHIE